MSAAEADDVIAVDGRKASDRIVTRAVAEVTAGDGRTLDVRIVPYGVVTRVTDPGRPPYREQWMEGAFADQVRATGRERQVFVNYRHGQGIQDVLGHGTALREEGDGFYGSFHIHDGADGDKALYMVEQKVLAGVSLEAVPKKSIRSNDGVVQRVKAHLVNIALCPNPAYEGAGVLAIREDEIADVSLLEEELAPELDVDLIERCVRLGIALPERMAEMIERAFTDTAWDGGSSRWATAETYCASSAIDLNMPGAKKTKDACHLPFKEPGSGAMNVNGIRAALARLGEGFPNEASQAQRDAAASRLRRLLASYNTQQG